MILVLLEDTKCQIFVEICQAEKEEKTSMLYYIIEVHDFLNKDKYQDSQGTSRIINWMRGKVPENDC